VLDFSNLVVLRIKKPNIISLRFRVDKKLLNLV